MLAAGAPLGLCDTNGVEFRVGCIVRSECINQDIHGTWVDYEITLQGVIPILSYLRSEKGEILKVGGTACCLSDIYDNEQFVFAKDAMSLRPEDKYLIQR